MDAACWPAQQRGGGWAADAWSVGVRVGVDADVNVDVGGRASKGKNKVENS